MPGQIGVTPDVAFRQAVALQQKGDFAGAEKIYRAILGRYPSHFQTLSNLGTVLLFSERLEAAVGVLHKALNQNPNSAVAQTLLAHALHLLDRDSESLERVRRAITLDPALPDAHATLAQVLSDLGRYDEARDALARAIALAPNNPRFYYCWGQIARWTADDPRLAALETLTGKAASLPIGQQAELHFALAGAHADRGDVEQAFRCQIEGGRLLRRILPYDEASTLREMEDLCHTVDAAWLARYHGAGEASPLPVFIVGMARSGTSLVEQILASHPQVRGLGERLDFPNAIARVCGTPAVPASLARYVARWSGAELHRLGALYLTTVRRDSPEDVGRVTDKLPANFQFAGLIHAALPAARIIHIRRDPIDTCLSLFSILFSGHSQPYSYDLGELGRYYRTYEKVMAHWRSALPPGVMLEVQYEDVVNDLEQQARRMVAHCGLEWDDACLTFHKTERPVRTLSHAQVRQPIYRTSVGRPRPPHELMRPLLETFSTSRTAGPRSG
ncbi:MAG: sulfotransferase [Steroidobacteraceae bacterium]